MYELQLEAATLQQYLPFTVLKLWKLLFCKIFILVATVLTVYGIETSCTASRVHLLSVRCNSTYRLRYWNLMIILGSVVGLSCNSTYRLRYWNVLRNRRLILRLHPVATVLTVYGIETGLHQEPCRWSIQTLQQYLPFTVLKLPTGNSPLPAVNLVATVLTVYGIETI